MRVWISSLGVLLIAVLGCSRPAEPPADEGAAPWQLIASYEFTETQEAQRELALAAVNAMMSETLGELEAALTGGDPAEGIAACRNKTPEIAHRVGEQFGVELGRTSFALRNPANTPPPWAEEQVEGRVDEPTFLAGPAGEFGALLPIRLKAECQTCHGPKEMIAEGTLSAIAEQYPDDQGVGFAEGDLRGWYWIEVPGAPAETEL
jgi:hypothetical protein